MRLRFTVPKLIFMAFLSTRIYIDTSVIGGYYDDEFKEYSRALFQEFISGKKIAILSDITLAELKRAPKRIQKLIDKIPKREVENVEMTEEADELSEMYVKEGIVSKNDFVDAQHIALATIINADVSVSWNFRLIVNLERIRKIQFC